MKVEIEKDIQKGLVGSKILLSGSVCPDINSTNSFEFQDKRYLPFYYHLGKHIKPEKVLQVNPKLGLVASCFLKSCNSVNKWDVLGDFDRFIYSNLSKKVELSFLKETKDLYDLCLITGDFSREQLSLVWPLIKSEGFLVVDYIKDNDVFQEFVGTQSRDLSYFDTRYGVGLVKK